MSEQYIDLGALRVESTWDAPVSNERGFVASFDDGHIRTTLFADGRKVSRPLDLSGYWQLLRDPEAPR